jgi:hypothetical protein
VLKSHVSGVVFAYLAGAREQRGQVVLHLAHRLEVRDDADAEAHVARGVRRRLVARVQLELLVGLARQQLVEVRPLREGAGAEGAREPSAASALRARLRSPH